MNLGAVNLGATVKDVLFVIPRIELTSSGIMVGGSIVAMTTLAKALSKHVSIHIIAGVKQKDVLENNVLFRGLNIYPVTCVAPKSTVSYAIEFVMRACIEARRIGKEHQIDIVHGHSGYTLYILATLFVSRIIKVPALHTLYCPLLENSLIYRKVSSILYLTTSRILLNSIQRVLTMSKNVQVSVLKAGLRNEQVALSPTAIDLEKFSLNPINNKTRERLGLSNEKTILFVGNVTESKGVDILLDAFGLLSKKRQDIVLVVTFELNLIGLEKRARKIKKRLEGLGKQARLLGIIDYMSDLMNAADLIVAPYRNTDGPSDYPLSLLEAMACGRPVIGTSVGGIPEIIKDGWNGKLIEPNNSEKLAEACSDILDNQEIAKEYGKNGRQFVEENFSPDSVALKTIKLYQKELTNV